MGTTMKITVNQLRKLIKEEVQKLTEATRNPYNLQQDLEDMTPGDILDLEIHTDRGVVPGIISKEMASPQQLSSYDSDEDEEAFMYTLEMDGEELVSGIYPSEITDFFADKGWEFSY